MESTLSTALLLLSGFVSIVVIITALVGLNDTIVSIAKLIKNRSNHS